MTVATGVPMFTAIITPIPWICYLIAGGISPLEPVRHALAAAFVYARARRTIPRPLRVALATSVLILTVLAFTRVALVW